MRKAISLLALAVVVSSAWADLKVENLQPKNTRLVVLGVSGSDATGAGLIWDVTPAVGVESTEAGNQLVFTGPAGTYTVRVTAVVWDQKKLVKAAILVTIGQSVVDPPPPPPPTTALYFAVVRADGPAAPSFTAAMSLPAWRALVAAGHSVKDFTISEAAALGLILPAGTAYPVVVTMRNGETSATIVRGAIPLPATESGILDLPKGVR